MKWLFANVILLKRSIKNESVQSNYFPRGGIINISDEMMMHTRETGKRERERERERETGASIFANPERQRH